MPTNKENPSSCQKLYADLLKRAVTYSIWGEDYAPVDLWGGSRKFRLVGGPLIVKLLRTANLRLFRTTKFDLEKRQLGQDWPPQAHTMIGWRRLENIQYCAETIFGDKIPGDFIETGVWRGGSCIFMRGLIKAYNEDRCVWVADSFEGLPRNNPQEYPKDVFDWSTLNTAIAVSLEEVKGNFERYGLLDDKVRFLKGWFRDTLPTAPIEKLALLRLDGDAYESTMDALRNLYKKVSSGGFVIIDDYNIYSSYEAVHDFRKQNRITEEIKLIDANGAYWRK